MRTSINQLLRSVQYQTQRQREGASRRWCGTKISEASFEGCRFKSTSWIKASTPCVTQTSHSWLGNSLSLFQKGRLTCVHWCCHRTKLGKWCLTWSMTSCLCSCPWCQWHTPWYNLSRSRGIKSNWKRTFVIPTQAVPVYSVCANFYSR